MIAAEFSCPKGYCFLMASILLRLSEVNSKGVESLFRGWFSWVTRMSDFLDADVDKRAFEGVDLEAALDTSLESIFFAILFFKNENSNFFLKKIFKNFLD